MKVRYLSVAQLELEDAIEFYESVDSGLGIRFYSEIRNSIDRIRQFPDAWSPLTPNTRRCRTKVFPYGVIYQVRGDEILILAVAHLNRRPNYWKGRL
jgi:hypothetical protein